MKSFKQEKILYSVTEVAEMFDIEPSTLRYWEKEFKFVRPARTEKGTRQYRKKDIEDIRLVYHLVKEKGFTLAGAKEQLEKNRDRVINTEDIIYRLKNVCAELLALQDELGS
ncbi:transcriptional regulator [Bacteroidia bacterium]|nr:transcriptional regulator [Bacteroidia bacterium]